MAYLKPAWFTSKIFNPVAMVTGISKTETLTVIKRSTGQPQRIPVVTVEVGAIRYLVSTRGESQWVRNVRADLNVTVTSSSGAIHYTAREIPALERQPILTAYRKKAGKAVEGYFRKLPDPADHPVFALTPS
jgi:deazaflavin-dependent oxidoreductase (nitroreductase family)